jgi:hypothetical protein
MPNGRHPNPDQGGREQYKRHVDGEISVRGQLEVHPPPDAAKAENTDKEDQKSHRNKSFVVSIFTLIAVVIYAGLTAWQGCLTRQSIANNSTQFQIDQRPNVWIPENDPTKRFHIAPNDRISMDISWINFGKQPAIRVKAAGKIFVGPQALQDADAWFGGLGYGRPFPKSVDGETVIPPGIPPNPDKPFMEFSTLYSDEAITQEQANYVLGNDFPIAIVARIQYSDASGTLYWSDLCISRAKSGSFPHCFKHNEMH